MKPLRHIIQSQDFTLEWLAEIFVLADELEPISHRGSLDTLNDYILSTLFYEESTRTRLSFEAAMQLLGGKVLSTPNAKFSSAAKGEELSDTIQIVAGYSDVIVLRHPEQGSSQLAARVSSVPIINAGDGNDQHPTQAILDLYTIQKEIGRLEGVTVGFVGDLLNGRTVHSLVYLLAKFQPNMFYFVSHPAVAIKDDIKDYLRRHGVRFEECEDLMRVARDVDVLYVTRIQRERFDQNLRAQYDDIQRSYTVDRSVLAVMQKTARIMHPLPRLGELPPSVDSDERVAHIRQAKNGLCIRMAILQKVLLG